MSYNAWFAKEQNRTENPPVDIRGMLFSEYRIDKHPDCTCWINTEADLYVEGAAPFRIYQGRDMVEKTGFTRLAAALRRATGF